MDNKARFDQLESLLADLARKQDQQSDQISQIIAELKRQGEILSWQSEAIERQSEAIERQSEAIGQQSEEINRQGEAIGRQGDAIGRQSEVIGRQGDAIGRIEQRLDNLSEQVDDILNILKISAAAHQDTEKKQAEMLLEIREQGRRQDIALDAIKVLLSRAEAVDKRVGGVIESQRQIIQLSQLNTESIEGQEPRIQRLEDEVFRQAS